MLLITWQLEKEVEKKKKKERKKAVRAVPSSSGSKELSLALHVQ